MRVDILGPVTVRVGTQDVALPRRAERVLLATLALRVGRVVSLETLGRALWDDDPPESATKSLRSHLSRLRARLGPEVARPVSGGCLMDLAEDAVDVGVLERLLVSGRAALDSGDLAQARRAFGQAEALWRGEPLTDFVDSSLRTAELERLGELHWRARLGHTEVELALGRQEQVLGELQDMVAEDPLREQTWRLLILALYWCGRQVEALRAYRRLRETLQAEWGVDPSHELKRLEWQILRQDPQLDPHPPAPPCVVPAPVSSFVGRAGQVDAVVRVVVERRLVTLHGPAGVGKSRLAVEAAWRLQDRFPDGVWWVDLTVVTDTAGAVRQMAETLGVSAAPGLPLEQALAGYLSRRRLLMVLDNCEHVARPLAAAVLELMQAAPGLHVLATSRVVLQVSGETRWEVPPLTAPPAGADSEAILESDAVALFQQRRGRQVADTEPNMVADVGLLCRTLDGVPLALELAAAQTHRLTVRELNDRLGAEVFQPAGQVASEAHHASLQQAIDWSYAVLDPACQQLFDWLSVFPADFDERAAESVGAAIPGGSPERGRSCLAALVEASLVQPRVVGETTRYRLLFVMREFAASRLADRAETEPAGQALTDHYRRLAERASQHLDGARPGRWLSTIRCELVNLRAAIDWSVHHEPPGAALPFVHAVGRIVWSQSADLRADLAQLTQVVEQADTPSAAPAGRDAVAWGWAELVTAAYLAGDVATALRAAHRARPIFEASDNLTGLAAVHWHLGSTQLLATGDLPEAERTLREGASIAESAGSVTPQAWCLEHLVQLHCLAGRVTDESVATEARAAELADPQDFQIQAHILLNTSLLHLARGDYEGALAAGEQCEHYSHACGNSSMEQAGIVIQGIALVLRGDFARAQPVLLRAAQVALDVSNDMQLGLALQFLVPIADRDGDPTRTARLWGASTARTPVWPAWAGVIDPRNARSALGDRFEHEVDAGRRLAAEQAMGVAIG